MNKKDYDILKKHLFIVLIFFTSLVLYAQSNDSLINDYLKKAKVAVSSSDYDNAISYYEKALELQKQNYGEESLEVAETCDSIGESYTTVSNYDKALPYFENSLNIKKNLLGDNNQETLKTYSFVGHIYYYKKDWYRALSHYDKIINIAKENGWEKTNIANWYVNIGNVYACLVYYDEALKYYLEASEIIEDLGINDEKFLAQLFYNMAIAYYNIQDFNNALKNCEKSYDLFNNMFGIENLNIADLNLLIGNIYYSQEDYDRALLNYNEALQVQKKILGETSNDTARSYISIGGIYYVKQEYATALDYYEKAIKIREKLLGTNHPDTAALYWAIADAYFNKGDFSNYLDYAWKTAESYLSIGIDFSDKGNYEFAISYYKSALYLREKLLFDEQSLLTAFCYNNLGNAYCNINDYENALSNLLKALSINEDLLKTKPDDYDVESNISGNYMNIGNIYFAKSDYNNALNYYNKALLLQLKISENDSLDVSNLYLNISNVYAGMGDYDLGLSYLTKSLDIRKKLFSENSPEMADVYENIGIIYEYMEYYTKSIEFYRKAIDIRQITLGEYHKKTIQSICNLAGVYYCLDDYDNAIELYKIVQNTCERINFSFTLLRADALQGIALCHMNSKEYKESTIYFEKTLAIKNTIFNEDNYFKSNTYSNFGKMYEKKGDYESALIYYKKSQNGLAQSSRYKDAIRILSNQIFSQIHDTDFLRETLTLATDTVERARLDMSSLKDDILRQSLPIYYYGVQFESEQKNPKKAFEYSESLRSRGFLDQIGTEAALKLDGVTDEEREQIHSLTSEITYARKTIEAENSKTIDERDEKRLSEAGKKLSDSEKALASLDKTIGKRIPAYSQLRNPLPVSASEAQKWCGKKRAVLEYVLWNPELTDNKDAKIKSYCLVLTDKKITAVELDGEYDYTKAINKLRGSITGIKRETQFENVRNELYEKLIAPVLPYVGSAKELVIVPDGNLSFLPFDVLRKNDSSKMLGDKYAIALSPSVSVSVLCNKYSASAQKMLAFGGAWYDTSLSPDAQRRSFIDGTRGVNRGTVQTDFALDEMNEKQLTYTKRDIQQNGPANYFAQKKLNWQNLPGTLTELGSICNLFKQSDFTEITQEKAAEYNVKELSKAGELSKYGILHFACHGYFDKSLAEMSSVLFSEVSGKLTDSSNDDGYLTIGEAAVLNLNADIVCLSACETGLGEVKAGDGIVGLSRAFMVAGAKHVGASLWCVDDEATAKFMSSMYKKITKGMDYVTAYQKTKAEFRKDEDFNHPYYWSAFVLYE